MAWWRMVKTSGELLSYLPGGVARQAAQLVDEGVAIKPSGTPRLDGLKAHLVCF